MFRSGPWQPELARYYKEYFEAMKHGTLFVCSIQDGETKALSYLETTDEEETAGKIRVFFRKNDMIQYCHYVAKQEGMNPYKVRRWEVSTENLINYLRTLDQRHREASKKGIRAVTSVIHEDSFFTLDIFWTQELDVMV